MQQDSQKDFDFFKELKTIENNLSSPLILKMWSMFLLAQYRCFKTLSHFSKHIIVVIILFLFLFLLSFVLNKIDKNQKTIAYHKIETIKEIDSNEFAKIQAHLVKNKKIELQKTVEMYWVANFLIEQGKFLSVRKVNMIIQDHNANINDFYDKRQFELTQAYDYVNKGRMDLISQTHDKGDPIDKLLNWETFTKIGTIHLQPKTIELNKEWMAYVKDPVKLSEYLATKKTSIDSGKIF